MNKQQLTNDQKTESISQAGYRYETGDITRNKIRTSKYLDCSLFNGEWINTDSEAKGVERVVFQDVQGRTTMHAFVRSEEGLIDLGEAEACVLAETADGTEGSKFCAEYCFDSMQVRMHGWVKLGVLVISSFNLDTSGSEENHFFMREFFYAADGS